MKSKKLILSLSILACASFLVLLIGKTSKKLFDNETKGASSKYKILILGGGSAGLTAANYLAMAGYKPIILEGDNPGGLITQSEAVRNWPAEVEIAGERLANKMKEQAKLNGAQIISEKAIAADFSSSPYKVISQSISQPNKTTTIEANTIIIAMGTRSNYLGVKGEQGPDGYWGRGVTNCAVCDGNLYKDKTVAVIGGGDGAIVEASYLLKLVNKLYLIVRRDQLRAYDKRKYDVLANPKTKVLFNTSVEEIIGNGKNVKGLALINNQTKEKSKIEVDGVFLAIGSKPNSEIFKGQLNLDSEGYIKTNKSHETSKKGIFAVGDIVDKIYKQATTAAGRGAEAAIELKDFLEKQGLDDTEETMIEEKVETPKAAPAPIAPTIVEKPKAPKKEPMQYVEQKEAIFEPRSAEEFDRKIKTSNVPMIIDFYAPWCGPCQRMHPMFERLAEKYRGKINFIQIDIDQLDKVSQKYEVRGIPAFILLNKEGREADRLVGSQEEYVIEGALNKLIK